MNSIRLSFGRLLALLLFALIPVSCGQAPLPEVPAVEDLGFEDSLDVVRRQVINSYKRWQDEPQNAQHNGHLGMVLSAYGKNAAAELFFKRARMLEPEEFRWAYYLAVARQYLGRYEESASAFREALTIDPDSIEARIQLAGVLFEINETARSIELYQEITTEFPERIDAWLGLGKALDRSGDPDAAFNALRRAKDIGPQFGDVRFALAAVLRARGDHEGAARELAAYEKRARVTINTSDQYTTAVVRLNVSDQPLLSKADYQIARGQFGEAVRFFRQALEINPENQDAWGGLVYSLARTGDKDATAEGYREALAAGIRYKRLHFAYGEALRKWKQFDAAREVIGKATELDPQYTEALLAMAELELQRGEHAAAIEQYRRAVAVVPNDRTVVFSLAKALNAAGEFERAISRLEPLVNDAALDTAETLKELAVAYHGLKRKDEAIDALRRSREAASKSFRSVMVNSIDELLATWYPGSTFESR